MPIPMPTVVAKGSTALALDARYATPEGRWASLKALRAAYSAGQDGVNAAATVGSLAKNERDHLRGHWFTAATDHWMMLKPAWNATPWFPSSVFITYEPTQPDLTHGARVLTAGLIQALEASLGLKGPDDSPPLQLGSNGAPISVNGLDQVNAGALERNLTVVVYWVCGKLDGFEVQVSWNKHQVTCFILTPQVAEAADEFKALFNPGDLEKIKTDKVYTEGMLVTTTKKGSSTIETIILARAEGGVNSNPLSRGPRQPQAPVNAPVLPGGTP